MEISTIPFKAEVWLVLFDWFTNQNIFYFLRNEYFILKRILKVSMLAFALNGNNLTGVDSLPLEHR